MLRVVTSGVHRTLQLRLRVTADSSCVYTLEVLSDRLDRCRCSLSFAFELEKQMHCFDTGRHAGDTQKELRDFAKAVYDVDRELEDLRGFDDSSTGGAQGQVPSDVGAWGRVGAVAWRLVAADDAAFAGRGQTLPCSQILLRKVPRSSGGPAWDRAEVDLTRNSESADASSPPCASVFFDVRAAPAASLPLRFVTALAADLDSSALEAALDEFLRGLCVALSLLHNVIYVFLYM